MKIRLLSILYNDELMDGAAFVYEAHYAAGATQRHTVSVGYEVIRSRTFADVAAIARASAHAYFLRWLAGEIDRAVSTRRATDIDNEGG